MARIFLSFQNAIADPHNPHAMPCFYESFVDGLKAAGNDLFVYHHRNAKAHYANSGSLSTIPGDLLAQVKAFEPDLFLLFNNSFYDVSPHFDCPIVVYEVDSVLYYANKEALKAKPERYKYLVPQMESIRVIHEELGVDKKNIHYVPFFTSIQAEDIPQTTNISFIGSKFTLSSVPQIWNTFRALNPSPEEVELFRQVLETVKYQPFITEEELARQLKIESPKVLRALNVKSMIASLSDTKRIQILSEVADLGLDLYGTKSWKTDMLYFPELTLSFVDKSVYSKQHNQDIYNASKLCININHIQAKTGFSWRVCDVMASNGCLVSEYAPDFKRAFPKLDLPMFTNRFEAREQCLRLLKNENLRKDIVAQCQEAIDEKYRFKHLLGRMEEILGMSLQAKVREDQDVRLVCAMTATKRKGLREKRTFMKLQLMIYALAFSLSLLPGFSHLIKRDNILMRLNGKKDKLYPGRA